MRFDHRTTVILILLTCLATTSAWATPPDDKILVAPENVNTTISWCGLLENDKVPCGTPGGPRTVVVSWPVHGELVEFQGGDLHYSPRDSFWGLGTDTFTYYVEGPGLDPTFATVTLQAGHYGRYRRFEDGFESGSVTGLSGNISVLPEAAIAGAYGLRASAGGTVDTSVFTFENDGNDFGELCLVLRTPSGCNVSGTGAQGGNDTMIVRPPPIGNRGFAQVGRAVSPGPQGGASFVIYSLERQVDDRAADILLTPVSGGWAVSARLYHDGSVDATVPFPLSKLEHELRIDWWNGFTDPTGTRDGGLMLWVDGEVVGSITEIPDWLVRQARRRIGVMLGREGALAATVDFDDVALKSTDWASPAFEPALRDSFERGLAAWDTSSATYIQTRKAASLIGEWGLEVQPVLGIDSHLGSSLLGGSSSGPATRFGVRFRFAPGTLWMQSVDSLKMLAISESDDAASDQVRLILRKVHDEFRLIPMVRSNNQWALTSGVTLANGVNTIELHWKASDEGASNGGLLLWLDGTLSHKAQEIDNFGATIGALRLGAWDPSGVMLGEFYLDGFESWSNVESE